MRRKQWVNAVCWSLSLIMLAALGVQCLSPWRWVVVLGSSVSGTLALMETRTDLEMTPATGDYVVLRWQGVDPNSQARLKQGTRLIKRIASGRGIACAWPRKKHGV